MKTTKVDHKAAIRRLELRYSQLSWERTYARREWLANTDRSKREEMYDRYHANDEEIDRLESEIRFHRIMLQEKKYATMWLYTDAHAYEIIEEKSEKVITVRRLKATIKPEAARRLNESFVPGGFCGHFNNDAQEWDFASDESAPIETICRHKNGRWYGSGKSRFTIEEEPYERFDYNF